jgi:hypothetical protein
VDIKLDLIVLEIELDQLKSKKHAALDTLGSSCLRCILLSSARFFLIGWPSKRYRSLALGQVSHSVWTNDAVSSLNNKDYTIKVSGGSQDGGDQ